MEGEIAMLEEREPKRVTVNALVSLTEWMVCPDGKLYMALYGNVEILDGVVGVGQDLFMKGNSEVVTVSKDSIASAFICNSIPEEGEVETWIQDAGGIRIDKAPSRIYFLK